LVAIGIVVVTLALVGAGCGSASPNSGGTSGGSGTTTGQVKFAKTKFLLHAGLAFGAFHHYIYKPAKAGELSHPFSHKLTTLKAALAGAFIYHEIKLALTDAKSDRTLSKLVAPISALQDKLKGLAGQVKSGSINSGSVDGLASSISSLKQQSASAGSPITEQTPSSPTG
jgi:hypothetical protein